MHLVLCPCGNIIDQHSPQSKQICLERDTGLAIPFLHDKEERPLFREFNSPTPLSQNQVLGCKKHRRVQQTQPAPHLNISLPKPTSAEGTTATSPFPMDISLAPSHSTPKPSPVMPMSQGETSAHDSLARPPRTQPSSHADQDQDQNEEAHLHASPSWILKQVPQATVAHASTSKQDLLSNKAGKLGQLARQQSCLPSTSETTLLPYADTTLKTYKLKASDGAKEHIRDNLADHKDHTAIAKAASRYSLPIPSKELQFEIVEDNNPRLIHVHQHFRTFAASRGLYALDTSAFTPKALASVATQWFDNVFLVEPGQESKLLKPMQDALQKFKSITIFIVAKATSKPITSIAAITIPEELSLLLNTLSLFAVGQVALKDALYKAVAKHKLPLSRKTALMVDITAQMIATSFPSSLVITKQGEQVTLQARIVEVHSRAWLPVQGMEKPEPSDILMEAIVHSMTPSGQVFSTPTITFIHPEAYAEPRTSRPYYKRKRVGHLQMYRSGKMTQISKEMVVKLFAHFPGLTK